VAYTLSIVILSIMLLGLQASLWLGKGSYQEVYQLEKQISLQKQENAGLYERNQALYEEVKDLRDGLQAVEERARTELGMIQQDETFFQIIQD